MNLKRKLKQNKLTIGSWITLTDTAIPEIMSKAGFEWLVVDMEHSAITLDKAFGLIQVIRLCGLPALVRVSSNDPDIIKRVMDCGASGVIVPMVNTKDDAEKAVQAVQYPPTGKRGVGLFRAQGYGLDFENYKKWLKKESIVIVQIEHKDAVDSIDEILSTEGIDGIFIGPYDLSGSFGYPGEYEREDVKNALKRVISAAKKSKIPAGFHVVNPDVLDVRRKAREGYKILAYSFDALLLGTTCKESLKKIRK